VPVGRILAAGAVAACAVLALDVSLPRGVAIGTLYVVVVALGALATRSVHVVALAAVCTAFGLVAIWLKDPSVVPMRYVLVNRGVSIVAIWTVVLMAVVAQRRLAAASRAEADRDRSKLLLERAIEQTPDAIFIVGRKGVIEAANPAASRTFGYDDGELVGQTVDALVPEPVRAKHLALRERYGREPTVRAMGTGRVLRGVRKDGSELSAEVSLAPVGTDGLVVVALRDVSERVRFEERRHAAQRMETVGRLAGGVAHDFNNLLAVILTCAELIREEAPAPRDDVEDILAAARRGADLTRQLLAFSSRRQVSPRRIDVNAQVSDTRKMLARILGEDVEIETHLGAGVWTVEIDPSQLEQVLLNLVVNARDAMPGGGKLTIETGNVDLDESYAREHPDVTPGEHALLAVSDTGVGMTADVRLRIFEPFFSTKAPGAGSGMGLATVFGIVQQAGGHIWVCSEPAHGTTFKIYLPRAKGEPERLAPVRESQLPRGGGEAILVVEDEPLVRRAMVRVLRKGGYDIVEASNGLEAFAKLETLPGKFALMLTDVVMPQMGGPELAERVRKKYPDIRVLLVSGYTEKAIVHHGVLDTGLAFLEKPFTPDVLLRKVRELLDASAPR
jgi:PAS domain S-box-containing protein